MARSTLALVVTCALVGCTTGPPTSAFRPLSQHRALPPLDPEAVELHWDGRPKRDYLAIARVTATRRKEPAALLALRKLAAKHGCHALVSIDVDHTTRVNRVMWEEAVHSVVSINATCIAYRKRSSQEQADVRGCQD